MRPLSVFLLFLVITTNSYAIEEKFIDPFVNPIKAKEEKLKKLKDLKRELGKESGKNSVKLFKAVIPRPLNELSIQGVISSDDRYILVVLDPETGETYMLKEGDAVSPSEKIVRITPSQVVIARYYYKRGRLIKSYETLNVNLEG